MKRYVIQSQVHNWDPWEVLPGHEYDTLAEARAALEAMPIKMGYRIAESYIQVRYKPVRIQEAE